MTRHTVVVDCESTGLRSEDIAVEVAWWDLATGARGQFIPRHDEQWALNFGEARALEINGYRERIEGKPQDDGTETQRLLDVLTGNVLAGSNPNADAGWLEHLFINVVPDALDFADAPRPGMPWHYRMWDLSAYAAGVLGLDELPGLAYTCELLGIEPGDHTAAADVTATGNCFLRLADIARSRTVFDASNEGVSA